VRLEERQPQRKAERRGRSAAAGRSEGRHGEAGGVAARGKGGTARPERRRLERRAAQEGRRSGGPRRSGGWRGEAAGHQARMRERRKREAAGGSWGGREILGFKARVEYVTICGLLMGRCWAWFLVGSCSS
jgi:hypothetical protein